MPIASGKTIELMAQYGLKAMVTLNGENILDEVICAYHTAFLKRGQNKQLGEDMIWGAGVYLADSHEEAIRRLEPAHDERFKWFGATLRNRTEDLNVKVCKEATDGVRASRRSNYKITATRCWRPRVKIGPALPDREKLEIEIARLRDLDVGQLRSVAYRIRPASAGSPYSSSPVSQPGVPDAGRPPWGLERRRCAPGALSISFSPQYADTVC